MGFPLFDWALWVQGQRCDVHEHNPEPLVVLFKEEGDDGCYLFNNDSYRDTTWNGKKPEWRIPPGVHVLQVTLLYKRKPDSWRFSLTNAGSGLEELTIEPLAQR